LTTGTGKAGPAGPLVRLRQGVPLVEVERSGVVESVHSGHVVMLGRNGEVLLSLGDPTQLIFPRSSNKPLQAVAMVRAGLAVEPAWTALAAASHSGEPMHVARVRAMLASADLTSDALGCPADWPMGEAARIAVLAGGGRPERVTMNCSGKHAAMLLTCRVNGWPERDYLDPDHPLQRWTRSVLGELAGEPVGRTGVDGCGAPLFALSLIGLARAFAGIGTSDSGPAWTVAEAMRSHPELIAGSGRSATAFMRSTPGLIAKDGAEGVYAAALRDGSALAIKIDDGGGRAADEVAAAGLRALGAMIPADLSGAPVLGGGRPVGTVRLCPCVEAVLGRVQV